MRCNGTVGQIEERDIRAFHIHSYRRERTTRVLPSSKQDEFLFSDLTTRSMNAVLDNYPHLIPKQESKVGISVLQNCSNGPA